MMHLGYILENHKVNVENTKITTENISISVSQLQIKQRFCPPLAKKWGDQKKFAKLSPPLSKPWRRPWTQENNARCSRTMQAS